MAVFLLIIILWLILIDSDSSFLLKVRWKIYYTWWRCHGCFLFFIIILCEILIDSDSSFLLNVRWAIYFTWLHCHGCVFSLLLYCVTFWYTAIALFYLRSYGQYILASDIIMAVFCYYYTLWRSGKTVGVLFYLRSDGQYIPVGDNVLGLFFVYYYTLWRSDRQWTSFSS